MTVPFAQAQQNTAAAPTITPAVADATGSNTSGEVLQPQFFTYSDGHNYAMDTFAIPACDEPLDYLQLSEPTLWSCTSPNSRNIMQHNTAAAQAAIFDPQQLNLFNPEFEDAFAVQQRLHTPTPPVQVTKAVPTPAQSLSQRKQQQQQQEAYDDEDQHYYEQDPAAPASPRSPTITRPKKKKKRMMKKQRKQMLLQLQQHNNSKQNSSNSPMQLADSDEEENNNRPRVTFPSKPPQLVNNNSPASNNCKLFISHLVRSSDKEKTELVPITRGALYLSTPHVHKLIVQLQHHYDSTTPSTTSTAPLHSNSTPLPIISLVLYRRVFRGEAVVNGSKDKVVELEGKKWRPVNFAQGLKGEAIKNAIAVRKAYKPQLLNNAQPARRLLLQKDNIHAVMMPQTYEYQFDIQFLVNSFNTSRELEYANFVIQVRKSYDGDDSEEVLFNSEPFRLRARNDYVESKKRRLIMEGDEDDEEHVVGNKK